jgi:hypothetical protein
MVVERRGSVSFGVEDGVCVSGFGGGWEDF